MRRSLSFALALALFAALGCASVPQLRPPIELPRGQSVELAVAAQAGANQEAATPGGSAWAAIRTESGIDFFAMGHGFAGMPYDGFSYDGAQVGAGAGLRYRLEQTLVPELRFAFEVYLDYLQDNYGFNSRAARSAERRHISAFARLPIVQQAAPGIWVYTAPTIGVSLPIYDDPPLPFFGIQEMPLGIVFRVTDWLFVVGEGGYYVPLNGGYLTIGTMFTL
jgi:hypothetical protein